MNLRYALATSVPVLAVGLALGACGGPGESFRSSGSALTGDGGSEGGGSQSCTATLGGSTVTCADSIFVTESTALANFSLQSVLQQIISTSKDTSLTPLALYQQMFDTLNDSAHAQTAGPHCDANSPPSINGFEVLCPRQEGMLAATNPFTPGTQDTVLPVGLSNRFDLAPANGENCGQYRVVFAKGTGSNPFDRNFIIFEAVLPNPTFKTNGLAGCQPVAEFWANLSSETAAQRATDLQSFYFKGLKGFSPVIKAARYGFGNNTNTGQIRTNMFMFGRSYFGGEALGQPWELREFRLSEDCTVTPCSLVANNTVTQDNPFALLFAPGQTLSKSFEKEFISQVPALAGKNSSDPFTVINSISMATPTKYNAGESIEQPIAPPFTENEYFGQGSSATFLGAITAELSAIGRSDLTATDILDRATSQSCAGCHQTAVGTELSPKSGSQAAIDWPASNGFVQITENSTLSPALNDFFMPNRLQILVSFLTNGAPAPSGTVTVGGSQVGSAN